MKFNYKLSRLCGTAYGSHGPTASAASTKKPRNGGPKGANLVYTSDGKTLYSPVANRIQVIDLIQHTIRTLSFQARANIRRIALSPDDSMLIVADVTNYALLINVSRGSGVVLHRFKFQNPVKCMEFHPHGTHIAVSAGKHVDVWHTPQKRKEFAPFVLHRTYTGLTRDVVHISWSSDGSVLMGSGGDDNTARIWTLETTEDYMPVTLSGHRGPLVAAYLGSGGGKFSSGDETNHHGPIETAYTISSDGVIVTWSFERDDEEDSSDDDEEDSPSPETTMKNAVDFFTGGQQQVSLEESQANKKQRVAGSRKRRRTLNQAQHLVNGEWTMTKKHYVHPKGHESADISSATMDSSTNLLVIGFTTGLFGLYEMPDCTNIHTLSLSTQSIATLSLNRSGEWLAIGCTQPSNQLFVWEWRSETYILKQQGHDVAGMNCMSYSPDSSFIATGGNDGEIKLWNTLSGFCFVTFTEHKAPVQAITFGKSTVVLSASLDGTVRAHDLIRYRNFKTFTSPERGVQFHCLAVDEACEIICAGTIDTFDLYLWSMQTGHILDVLSGHRGPISTVSFHPTNGYLASSSWDGSVRLWDVYKKDTVGESLTHSTDVVCATFRPDGKMICTSTLNGELHFWKLDGDGDVNNSLAHIIDGRKDIAGGRKMNDRMMSRNKAASRYFTSVCFSADGTCVLAGGNSKYVCIYEVSQQILLKKFQISFNVSLDGVLDELHTKNLGDGGPIDTMDYSGDEANLKLMPGARRQADGSRTSRVEVLTSQVSFSSTGREWAAVSGEGLHIYSLDEDMIFDPIALTEVITPAGVQSALQLSQYGKALLLSLHLNESELVQQAIEATPYSSIAHVVKSVGPEHLERLMQFLVVCMTDSPHVEFYLQWCLELLQTHGRHLQRHRPKFMRAFRALHRVVQMRDDELKIVCDANRYTLEFVTEQANLTQQQQAQSMEPAR